MPDKKSPNLQQRLLAVMAECTYVQKHKKQGVPFLIVSHDVVTAKVRPYLIKHGIRYSPTVISFEQNGNRTTAEVQTTFINVDDPSDTESIVTFGYGVDTQDKGPGKAMSYAVKYAILKALALETGEDADHESIEYESIPTPATQEPTPAPATVYTPPAGNINATEELERIANAPAFEPEPQDTEQVFDDGSYEVGAVYDAVKKSLANFCIERKWKKVDLNTWIKGQYGGRTIAKMQNDDGLLLEVLKRVENEYAPQSGDAVTVGGVIPGKVV